MQLLDVGLELKTIKALQIKYVLHTHFQPTHIALNYTLPRRNYMFCTLRQTELIEVSLRLFVKLVAIYLEMCDMSRLLRTCHERQNIFAWFRKWWQNNNKPRNFHMHWLVYWMLWTLVRISLYYTKSMVPIHYSANGCWHWFNSVRIFFKFCN